MEKTVELTLSFALDEDEVKEIVDDPEADVNDAIREYVTKNWSRYAREADLDSVSVF